jgi:hypothetical protein
VEKEKKNNISNCSKKNINNRSQKLNPKIQQPIPSSSISSLTTATTIIIKNTSNTIS